MIENNVKNDGNLEVKKIIATPISFSSSFRPSYEGLFASPSFRIFV